MSTKKRVTKRRTTRKKQKKSLKGIIIAIALIVALGAVSYGGYTLYASRYIDSKKQQPTKNVPEVKTVKLEINEADTINSLAKKVSQKFPQLNMTQKQVVEYLNNRDKLAELRKTYTFIPESASAPSIQYPLEGLFIPLTYEYFENDTLDTIIKKPLDKMQVFYEKYNPQLKEKGIKFYDALILASITNAEVPTTDSKNMAMVAQVFNNRLQEGIGLGSDATLVYSLNKKELTNDDFAQNRNNPYNTRTNHKLTPTPIQFVTETSLNAIVNPTANDYYYFLTGTCQGRDDFGKFYYAKTYEEHQKNIQDHMVC